MNEPAPHARAHTHAAPASPHPLPHRVSAIFDPPHRRATLLGLQGIVIKSHGNADVFAFANAINVARLEITNGIIDHIRCQLDRQQNRPAAEEPTA